MSKITNHSNHSPRIDLSVAEDGEHSRLKSNSTLNSTIVSYRIVSRLNPVWHRMLYSFTHMATVGIKGLMSCS